MNDSLNASATRAFHIEQLPPPEPAVALHCAIFLDRNTILSAETFRLQRFQGQENVSELFEFQLELTGNTSTDSSQNSKRFSFDDIIGRPITVGIQTPALPGLSQTGFDELISGNSGVGNNANSQPALALFNGIVTSFSIKNRGNYSLTMKPALHRLTLTNNYRVYQQKSVWQMITTLLEAHNITYAPLHYSNDNLAVIRKQDWMQAGETDFDLLRRLLGKAHLHFYFTHTGNSHSVCFSNQAQYPDVFADGRALPYDYSDAQALGLTQANTITEYCLKKSLGSTSVHGVLTLQDGAWLDNSIVPFQSFRAESTETADALPFYLYKSYQYGGSKTEAQDFAIATKSTLDASRNELSGSSTCVHFHAAHRFTMSNGGNGDTNPSEASLEQGAFVLTSVSHEADADGGYHNQFQASDARFLITPYSIQDTQQGNVLAEVVSEATKQVQNPVEFGASSSFETAQTSFTDSLNTPSSSAQMGVYVRFSTADKQAAPVWIKLSSSMQTAPTIGSIVAVSRAQDESELPEIQNVIQTNGSTLVVPSGWLSNTHIGSNYSTNYGDNQSISYGRRATPNLQQSSTIVKNAYNSGNFDNVNFSQGSSYSFSCANSAAASAQSDSSELYGSDPLAQDILSASESFGSTYSRQIGDMSYSHSHINKSVNDSWNQTSESNSHVDDSTSSSYTGSMNSSSHTDSSVSSSYTGTSVSASLGEHSVTSSTLLTSTNNNNVGVSTNVSMTGLSINTSMTGASVELSRSGDSMRYSVSGDVEETNISGNILRSTTYIAMEENENICGKIVKRINGVVVDDNTTASETSIVSSGDSNKIETSAAATNIVTTAEITAVETAGPGARVSNNDETPHIDNIVTRICVIEGIFIFM
jgi:type VI secretion system secreted protein VgrG